MRFDLFRGQGVPWPDFVEDVRFIETTGAGTCWVLDHYFYPPAPEAQLLDSWTALGGLAAVTERIRLGTMVTDAALRHPAVLAKQIATVDRISNGRVDVTIGAGHFQEELEALGLSFLTPRGRADRLREDDARADAGAGASPASACRRERKAGLGLRLAAERADTSVTLGDNREMSTGQAVVSLRAQ
jgi:Luciferase-like monooxygenase